MSLIQTHVSQFDYSNPNPIFEIEDIAHALSHICRFSGFTKKFYSVAEHSLLVSELCPEHHQLEGLLHDAHEAYVGDVPTPLKAMLPDYRELEDLTESALRRFYQLPKSISTSVKRADTRALSLESGVVFAQGRNEELWEGMHKDAEIVTFRFMEPIEAKTRFMARYYELIQC